jgi:hypothetical protein
MSNFTKHLKAAWDKVRDFLNDEDHKRSIFHLSNEEAQTLRDEYRVCQQHTYIINKYGGVAATSIPTSLYKISNADKSLLDDAQIVKLEERLKTMRKPNNDASHNPSL